MKTYPYTTPESIIELVEKAQYDADVSQYSAEREHNAMQALMWQSVAESLASAAQGHDTTAIEYREWQHRMREALDAYESAKSGNPPDPLAEAVKRMEAVPKDEILEIWMTRTRLEWTFDDAMENVRARLISAAKGEQP